MTRPIQLVVGLGNPGPRYAPTRHNAGYWFVDTVAGDAGAVFRSSPRFFGEICESSLGGHRLRLLRPATFMNRSGQAVIALAHFYRYAPEDILVVHDEIDLPPGNVRLKRGGGHGGHNGLRDIIARLGSKDFVRLRIGVGHPGRSDDVIDYVLRRAGADEQVLIDQSIERAVEVLPTIIDGDLTRAMNQLNRRAKPANDDE